MSITVASPPSQDAEETAESVIRSLGIDLRSAPSVLLRIVAHVARYRVRFALAMCASVGATLFNIATPRLLGRAVDQAHALLKSGASQPGVALKALSVTALLILGASVLRGLLQMGAGYNSERLGQSVGRDLRNAYFEKLQRLGFDYHDGIHSGDLITRGMLDLEGMRGFIEMGMQRIIALGLLFFIGGWALFSQDWVMALVTFSFLPFAVWRAGRMGLRLRLAWTGLQERLGLVTLAMEENLQGARIVRAFPTYAFEMRKFDAAADEALALSNERIAIRSTSMTAISSSYYATMLLVLWVGGYRVTSGAITIGQLTEFLAFMTILQLPVRQIGMIVNSGARAVSSGARVYDVLDLEPKIRDAVQARPLEAPRGVLRFEKVNFAYGPDEPPVLKCISLEVRPGRTLGVVGPSGSGKTTLAHLVARFYDVSSGRITIDGQDVRDVTLASLRKAVHVVSQDVFLFDDSAERNIAYAEPDAHRRAVRSAAETAHLHEHLDGLPEGYETQVGERGWNLSGGQRQRLAIARGLVAEAKVLVLDDATSAVDAATEHGIARALASATSGQAKIVISHRLSSVMHADEIIVLDQGRIIERGTHASLLAAGGFYAELHALQTHAPAKASRPAEARQDA